MPELENLAGSPSVPIEVRGGLASKEGKANCLLQCYISRARLESFSLVADTAYISQARLMLFDAAVLLLALLSQP